MGKKKTGKLLAMLLTFAMILASFSITKPANAATTKSYDFSKMTCKSSWGTSHSINSGTANISFTGQYREIDFNLPETLDMSQCTSVTFNADSPNGSIAFKLYNASGKEVKAEYNFKSSTSDRTFSPGTSDQVNCIGIMAMDSNNFSAKVNSVSFTMNSSSPTTPTTPTPTTPSPTTPSPTTPNPTEGSTLLNTYGKVFGKVGSCINTYQLRDQNTLNGVKKQYNSLTLENEMKPDAILGGSSNLISVSDAKNLGYYIPEGYTESKVPKLNFSTVDGVLKTCYDNNISLRAHTLVWHAQTPDWFFKNGFQGSGSYVSKAVMDKRMEMYIKTYMKHVHTSSYGKVVYAWDVVNEYLHSGNSSWKTIYGNEGVKASFVKKAFQYAYECLQDLNLTDSVSLFYNDYNEYMVSDDIVTLINYINSEKKMCNGVGMQAHLDTSYPSTSLFGETLNKFQKAGLEIQITELDVTNNSDSVQATYMYNLFTEILKAKKAGANITNITFWGLYDSISWRSSQNPLLFKSLTQVKPSFNSVMKAYTEAGYK